MGAASSLRAAHAGLKSAATLEMRALASNGLDARRWRLLVSYFTSTFGVPCLDMQSAYAAPSKLRPLSRYALAIALVLMALWLSLVLQVPFGNPFWFFFAIAVIASTWFGGRGPGWVAVGLSTLAVLYYFIPPHPFVSCEAARCSVFSHICCLSNHRQLVDFMAKRNRRFPSPSPRRTRSKG